MKLENIEEVFQIKKGVNCWTLPYNISLREKMELAGDAGFEGIELSITKEGELNINSSPEELKRIKKSVRETGIIINSLACSLNWQCSLTSDIEEIRKRAKENILRQIEIASELEVDAILALPGFVGLDFKSTDLFKDPNEIDFFPGSEVIEYDFAWERAVSAFIELGRKAEENGVTICIENIWNKFLLSPIEMKLFIEQVSSNYVRVYFDTGNCMLYGYPEHWIKVLGHLIKRVHFKDFRRGVSSLVGFVDLLTGDVDFVKVVNQLESAGYDGWVTAEITNYKQYPELTVYNTSSAMDKILKRK